MVDSVCTSGRVGKSVKNSNDTIFQLEILAQKMRAKIAEMCKNEQKNAKICKNLQNFANMCKLYKNCVKI